MLETITIEELVQAKEGGLSDRQISEKFTKEGRAITKQMVSDRLTEYYNSLGQEKPKAKNGRPKIELPGLEERIEKGDSSEKIIKVYERQGYNGATITRRIKAYNGSGDPEKTIIRLREQQKNNRKIKEDREIG